METMELHQVLNIQKIALVLSMLFTISTVLLLVLNVFMSERVKVNLSKQVRKEKISFSNEDITLPSFEKTATKQNKSPDSSELLSKTDQRKDTQRERSSIFDLKDL
ncbi:MAG: hypothetical protein RMJ36_01805 [Candidatus Calescibacterium sp.]|nr:hypothetical protein [Candidatus Calescibacterium sp.]MDW8132373.1 hypothetical protein [Candidatus Calescibacterium sp.]